MGLLTGDVTLNKDASVLVMTTEILRSMLYRYRFFNDVFYPRVKLVKIKILGLESLRDLDLDKTMKILLQRRRVAEGNRMGDFRRDPLHEG